MPYESQHIRKKFQIKDICLFSDVDMKASICHYIIKNIAGQFCAVVEEECNALMLGTKDGMFDFIIYQFPVCNFNLTSLK